MQRSESRQKLFQVLIDSFDTPDLFGSNRFVQASLTFRKMISVQNGVMQVIKDPSPVNELSGPAEMVKAGSEIRILSQPPTFVLFIPAIDGQKIVGPCRHIATDDPPLPGVSPDYGERKTETLGRPAHHACEE
jgi:hypothetical protein